MRDDIKRINQQKMPALFGEVSIGVVFLTRFGIYMKVCEVGAVVLSGINIIGKIIRVDKYQPITLVKDPVISGTEVQ